MKRVLKIVGIVGIVVLCVVVLVAGLAGYGWYRLKNMKDSHDLEAQVDGICNKYIKKDKRRAGLWVGVVQGNDVLAKGFGVADRESGVVPDSNMVFEIGSVTKVLTALMAQHMVAEGRMGWQDRIGKYMPAEVGWPADDATTLEHLVTHTSGLPRLPEVWMGKLEADSCNPYRSLTMNDLLAYLQHPLDKKKPGAEGYNYSNVGAGLLGHILEWRSGQSYDALLRQYVTGPLGMQHTYCGAPTGGEREVTGYDEEGRKTCNWTFGVLGGAGCVRATGGDMLRLLRAELAAARGVGDKAMAATQKEVHSIAGGAIGYGWHVDKNGALMGLDRVVWHNGGTGGYRSYVAMIGRTDRGLVVLGNQSDEGFDELAMKLVLRVAKVSMK